MFNNSIQKKAEINLVETLIERIKTIPEGAYLMTLLEKNNFEILIDDQLDALGSCRPYGDPVDGQIKVTSGYIFMNPLFHENEDEMLATLLHEAWHANQYIHGYGFLPVDPPAEDYCWHLRVMEADAQSFAIEACYKLKQNGDDKPWYALKDPIKTSYIDIVHMMGDDSVKNGMARGCAFSAWFGRTKVKDVYDDIAIMQRKSTYSGLVGDFVQQGRMKPLQKKSLELDFILGVFELSSVNYVADMMLDQDMFRRNISATNKALIRIKYPTQIKVTPPSFKK